MESNVVTAAVAAGVDPVGRPLGRSAGGADAPAPAPEQTPRHQSDAEFLAKAAATETPGSPRSTFARFIVDQFGDGRQKFTLKAIRSMVSSILGFVSAVVSIFAGLWEYLLK